MGYHVGNMERIAKQLEELGLSGNEVKVYLAGLELGGATAQQLAAKAAVVRPTAYVAIGGLTKRGLMSSYTKGKKQYFTAEKPDQLMRLLMEEKRKIAERESKLKSILPGLEAMLAMAGEKPEVKFYEGLEGLEAMQNVLFDSKATSIDIIVAQQKYQRTVPEEAIVLHNIRLKRAKISGRQIVITDKKRFSPFVQTSMWQYKIIRKKNFEFSGEVAIFGDYISLISYRDKPYGILVKGQDVAGVAKVLFDATWKT
jgi:sugar-specific transcriptional regulator TrmB